MSQEINLLKKGQFYFIYDGSGQNFVVEDKTKRGLPVVENNIDDYIGAITEKERFYDANGRGHVCLYDGTFPRKTTLWSKCANLLTHWIVATGL